jgi:NAD(P)-dependent dehydrogenase (short-subunit alcohol dehydrogenase family)
VALCDIDAEALAHTVEEIDGKLGTALSAVVDVSDSSAVARLVSRTVDAFGRIDVLVNNAGVSGPGTPFIELPEADWHRVLNVNLNGSFYCARHVAPHMVRARSGVIINISSVLGVATLPRSAAYAASKAGLIGFTKALAHELGPHNVRVNCVLPGSTDTPMMWDGLTPEERRSIEPEVAAQQPLRRIARPEEIAQAALFLASDDASFVTGAALVVDGGLLARIAAIR